MSPPRFLRALVALSLLASPLRAQHEPAPPGPAESRHEDAALPLPSWEFMASSAFRSATAIVPVGHRFAAELHYYGLPEPELRITVAQTALGYQVPVGRHGFIAPALGYFSGVHHGAFAGSVRWMLEAGPFVTEGMLVQGHDRSDEVDRAQFWDGNHVSLALFDRRLEVGPTFEHINVREEDAWKWGGRVAVRVHKRVLAQSYILTPGKTELRFGVLVR